jgi:hypothetical protein
MYEYTVHCILYTVLSARPVNRRSYLLQIFNSLLELLDWSKRVASSLVLASLLQSHDLLLVLLVAALPFLLQNKFLLRVLADVRHAESLAEVSEHLVFHSIALVVQLTHSTLLRLEAALQFWHRVLNNKYAKNIESTRRYSTICALEQISELQTIRLERIAKSELLHCGEVLYPELIGLALVFLALSLILDLEYESSRVQ